MPITNPDYIPPIEATFDEGKPIRSDQGMLLAGNPIAIANGALGAPRIQTEAIEDDAVTTAKILDNAVNLSKVDLRSTTYSGTVSVAGVFIPAPSGAAFFPVLNTASSVSAVIVDDGIFLDTQATNSPAYSLIWYWLA